jgi:hypothetical protein
MNAEPRNELLYDTLVKACSQNPLEMKDAELKLQQLETQFGYCINLFVCHLGILILKQKTK